MRGQSGKGGGRGKAFADGSVGGGRRVLGECKAQGSASGTKNGGGASLCQIYTEGVKEGHVPQKGVGEEQRVKNSIEETSRQKRPGLRSGGGGVKYPEHHLVNRTEKS